MKDRREASTAEMMAARGDRLSALPDATLTRILSHLRTEEAVRTCVLSRRWRRAYAAVPVVDIADPTPGKHDLRVAFSDILSGALLGRCGAAPIRALRLRSATRPKGSTVDLCLFLAISSGVEEIGVELGPWCHSYCMGNPVYRGKQVCPNTALDRTSDFFRPEQFHRIPRRVFCHATLRRLRLAGCAADVPGGVIALSSLETLFLEKVADNGALERLVVDCPRLGELTLSQCPTIKEISFSRSSSLRSFTLRCCHNIKHLAIDAPGLRSLHYEGGLSDASFSSLPIYPGVSTLEISICERLDKGNKVANVHRISELIAKHHNLNTLCLSSRPAMMFCGLQLSSMLPALIRRLELRGHLGDEHALRDVVGVLEKAPNLEVLALHFEPVDDAGRWWRRREREVDEDIAMGDMDRDVYVPHDLRKRHIRCLRSLKKIDLVELQGRRAERQLAKFLLSTARRLLEISVVFAAECCKDHGNEMLEELSSWRANPQAILKFSWSTVRIDS